MITNDPIGYRDDKILKDDEEFLKKKLKGKNEMAMLEAVINKIGGLLALGFGQGGTNIITTNLRNKGAFTTRILGKRFFGIFGEVRIQNFTEFSDYLEEDVFIFVNEIA